MKKCGWADGESHRREIDVERISKGWGGECSWMASLDSYTVLRQVYSVSWLQKPLVIAWVVAWPFAWNSWSVWPRSGQGHLTPPKVIWSHLKSHLVSITHADMQRMVICSLVVLLLTSVSLCIPGFAWLIIGLWLLLCMNDQAANCFTVNGASGYMRKVCILVSLSSLVSLVSVCSGLQHQH